MKTNQSLVSLVPLFLLTPIVFLVAGETRQKDEGQGYAKIPADKASLLNLMHLRADCENPERLDELVRQLGSRAFAKREIAAQTIVQFGYFALPALQNRFKDSDAELARRAQECAKKIESGSTLDWISPAVRHLAAARVAGGLEALLEVLPSVGDGEAEEEIYYALDEMINEGKEMPVPLVQALEDKNPARRAVAACIIGRRGNPGQLEIVRELMNRDANPMVRLRAAQGILARRETSPIPVLIDLLMDPAVAIGWQAEELLHWSTDSGVTPVYGCGTEAERKKCHAAWSQWWREHEKQFAWPAPELRTRGPGLVLIRDALGWKGNYFWLAGCEGTVRYAARDGVSDDMRSTAWFSNGRILVFCQNKKNHEERNRVEEVGLDGRVIKSSNLPFLPTKWRRLENGNVELIGEAALEMRHVYEWDSKTVLKTTSSPGPYRQLHGIRDGEVWKRTIHLHDGHTLSYARKTLHGDRYILLSERDNNGVDVWETCGGHALDVVYPLVRFGFKPAAGSVDNIANRLRQLTTPYGQLRAYALASLSRKNVHENVWKTVLGMARDDFEWNNRYSALWFLATSPELCRKHIDSLVEMLGRDDARFQDHLRAVFSEVGPEAIAPLMRVAENEPGAGKPNERRARAIYNLGALFLGTDNRVNAILHKAARDPDLKVRTKAVAAIASVISRECQLKQYDHAQTKEFLPEMIDAATSPDTKIAQFGVSSVALLGAAPARPILMNLLHTRKDVRAEVIYALNSIKKRDPALRGEFLPYLREEEGNAVVSAVLASLAIENAPTEVLQPVIRILQWKDLRHNGDMDVILELLEQYGPKAKDAVPALKEILHSHSPSVPYQRRIARCLKGIDPREGMEADRNIDEWIQIMNSPKAPRVPFPQNDTQAPR